jgi:probable rRNA maturation factor
MNPTLVIDRASDAPGIPDDATLSRWARHALAGNAPDAEVHLRIVDETEMRDLNTRFRNKPGVTNVLSFPAGVPADVPSPLLGDLAICAPVVAREAAEQGKPLAAHWAHLVIHGILHLLGHDHQTPDEATAMEALETRLLTALDFPPPYE